MEDISPEELSHLKELGQKIKAGQQLEQVTLTVVNAEGKEEQIVLTDPFLLHCFEKAAALTHDKFCKNDIEGTKDDHG